MRIGIDCDGVLARFEDGYVPLLTAETGIEFPRLDQEDWPDTWDYDLAAGVTKEQQSRVWEKIEVSPDFWYNLPPYKGAEEFLEKLRILALNGVKVWFVTNRPGESSKRQTILWLHNHRFPGAHVVVTANKAKAANQLGLDVYIDDKVENCEDVRDNSYGTKCFMLARPWNWPVEGVPRLERLEDFFEILKEMMEELDEAKGL